MSDRVVVDDVRGPVRDGTLLAADVAYVDDSKPRPALLIRTPYSRVAGRDAYDLVGLARQGWTVVLQDVRGRFDSAGDFAPFEETDDGADAVAWCAEQPWCDGRVVMTGVSYLGATQWAAARRPPSALKAINPLLAPSTSADEWLWRGDAFQLGLAQSWMLTVLATGQDDSIRATAAGLGQRWSKVVREPDDPVLALSPHYARWRQAPRRDDTWLPVHVPAFNVVGWYDVFAESGIAAHRTQAEAGAPILTVIGPWAHTERLTNLYPDFDVGSAGSGELLDTRGEGLRWLRERLDEPPADSVCRYYVVGAGEWRTAPTWPPASTPYRLFLHADGTVTDAPAEIDRRLTWRHDPSDAVPSWGGRVLGPYLPLPGPVDQRPVHGRDDVVTFVSEPLSASLIVTGDVTADVTIESTASSVDVVVSLNDIYPDGRIFPVVRDIRRSAPGNVTVQLGAAAHAFLAGHRIGVTVAGSDFPRYDVNPPLRADHTIVLGGRGASSVTLPVSG